MSSVDRNADRGARRPLHGRVVLITGAGTGIGRATALMAGRQGAALVLVGRRHAPLNSVAAAAAEGGARCLVLPGDISAASFAAHAVAATLDRFGGLDGLVNNAAIASFGALSETTDADVRGMFEVNLLAPLRFVREALPALKRRGGAVVNVSSIGGLVATPGRAPYGALKAALNHMTRSLARELAPHVRVNAVLPGLVSTPMHERLNVPAEQAASLLGEMVRTTPAGRMGQAEEIAPWICRLLEAESAWVTGSLFTLDGGRSA